MVNAARDGGGYGSGSRSRAHATSCAERFDLTFGCPERVEGPLVAQFARCLPHCNNHARRVRRSKFDLRQGLLEEPHEREIDISVIDTSETNRGIVGNEHALQHVGRQPQGSRSVGRSIGFPRCALFTCLGSRCDFVMHRREDLAHHLNQLLGIWKHDGSRDRPPLLVLVPRDALSAGDDLTDVERSELV